METFRPRTQCALVHVIAAVHEGRISHGDWGLEDQDPGTSHFPFDELSSLEVGNINMVGLR